VIRIVGIQVLSYFGNRISAPIVFAPIGVNKIYHNDGELAVVKVAGELNLPYCLR
jgi:isopentenyl diphosphate isomerase/L-lactate dehydrogenase-like FMN-dependent dehydrogenase